MNNKINWKNNKFLELHTIKHPILETSHGSNKWKKVLNIYRIDDTNLEEVKKKYKNISINNLYNKNNVAFIKEGIDKTGNHINQ